MAKSSGEFEMHSPNAFAACAHGFGCCGASDDGTLSVAYPEPPELPNKLAVAARPSELPTPQPKPW